MSEENKKTQGYAVVRCVIEVSVSNWGHDCTIGQVFAQAEREARERLEHMVASQSGIRLAGVEMVRAIAEEKRS